MAPLAVTEILNSAMNGPAARPAAWAVALFVCLTALVPRAYSQGPTAADEEAQPPAAPATKPAKIDRQVVADVIKPTISADGTAVTILRGNVKVTETRPDGTVTRIYADNAVIWSRRLVRMEGAAAPEEGEGAAAAPAGKEDAGPWEVYAEGDVKVEGAAGVTRCDRLYFDMGTDRGVLFNGWMKLVDERSAISLYARGREIRRQSRGRYEMANGAITTCPFGHPHYEFRARRMAIVADEARPDAAEKKDERPGVTITGKQNYLVLGDTPVLYSPVLHGGFRERYLIESFRAGSSSQFGPFAMTKWDLQQMGLLNNDWSRLSARTDYYGKRGFGYGAGFEYQRKDLGGNLELYEIRDVGKDRLGGLRLEPPVEDRGRVRWRHHQWLSDNLFGIVEASKSSDRRFLHEYYEREYEEGKDQENLGYLRWIDGNVMATATGSVRADDFLSQTEYMPQGSLGIFHQPIGDSGAYGSIEWEAAGVRRRFDDALHLPEHRVNRFDANNEVAYPFSFESLYVRPFLGLRGTFFDDSAAGGNTSRFVGTTGWRVSTQLHRQYDLHSDFLSLDGLRHVVRPDVRWYNVFSATKRSGDLYANDSVEAVDRLDIIRFGLRNLFQTRRSRRDDAGREAVNTFTFLAADLGFTYYPNKNRDNRPGPQFDDLVQTSPGGVGEGRSLSNLDLDLEYFLNDEISLATQTQYNGDSGKVDQSNVSIGYRRSASTFLGLGFSQVRNNGTSNYASFTNVFPFNNSLEAPVSPTGFITDEHQRSVVTLTGGTMLADKWEAAFQYSADLANAGRQDQSIIMRRWMHEWALDLRYEYDWGSRDTSFTVSLSTGNLVRETPKKLKRP